MKTTVHIPDSLLDQVRTLAARDHSTVRALIERGLRRVLAEQKRAAAFRIRKATFRGKGLQPGVADGGWERIRDLAYEGRGT
jgi:hypothetical protein